MTEERDPKISAAYRALGDEEPPPALDAAITAAARRAVDARPGRSGLRRWGPPLAAAAVLVLAVGVALQLEREQPLVEPPPMPPEAPAASPSTPPSPKAKPSAPTAREAPAAQPAVRAERHVEAAPAADNQKAPVLAAPAPEAPAAAASGAAPDRADRRGLSMERSAPEKNIAAPASARDATESPEQWLERIAALRRDGKHEEADRALAQFRSRYPDYRMSEELRRRVER